MLHFNRREFVAASTAALGAALLPCRATQAAEVSADAFQLKYVVGSCMYGYAPLSEIVPEVRRCGATALDIWPKVHGNQREQLDEMGEEKFAALLAEHQVALGCITQYKLGPFGLKAEIPLAARLGCRTIVAGAKGPAGLRGSELKSAVGQFVEQMKPHVALAEEHQVTLAIENHGNNLIESPDSLKWLVELRTSQHLAVALAPYHLPQDPAALGELIVALGEGIAVFYAWQHGLGSMKKLPKAQELLQMPGRGDLDFKPLVDALRKIKYQGWTEVFMHPVPRGVPILESTAAVTTEIQKARAYLDGLVR